MMNVGMSDYTMLQLPLSPPMDRLPPIGFERSLSNPSPTPSFNMSLSPAGLFAPTTPKDRCRIRRAKFYDRMEFACVLKQVTQRGVIKIIASDEWKFPIWNGNLDDSSAIPSLVVPSVSNKDGFSNAAGTAWHSVDTHYMNGAKEGSGAGLPGNVSGKCAFRMFVGGMPASMTAKQLAIVLNDIFGYVDCVRIQFNPGNSNPSRCATVDFRSIAAAFAAVYYQRIIVRTPEYCKALNIYPFIKNSAWCSMCSQVTYEPILCREVICMSKYMCLGCWKKSHRHQSVNRADHEPLMRHPTEEVKNIQMWFRFPPSLLEMIKNSVEFPEFLPPGILYDFSKPVALHDPIVNEIVGQIDGHDVLCHACHVSPPTTPLPQIVPSDIINPEYYEGILNASNALLQLLNGEH